MATDADSSLAAAGRHASLRAAQRYGVHVGPEHVLAIVGRLRRLEGRHRAIGPCLRLAVYPEGIERWLIDPAAFGIEGADRWMVCLFDRARGHLVTFLPDDAASTGGNKHEC